jgi:20S proteasome alpha/beta subunit
MTVLVGILCDDGVVIGSDSTMTFGAGPHIRTIEQSNAVKVHIIGNKLITATTGSVGLSQRYVEILKAMSNGGKLNQAKVMEQATFIAEEVAKDFRRTTSALQMQANHGWGLGALLGMAVNGNPELFEYDHIGFQPERKGDKDAEGKCRTTRIVSMGSGQTLADPFLGFISGVFWKDDAPRLVDAKLAVVWTLQHTITLNTGGIGGEVQLAVLEKINNQWTAHMADTGEIQEQIADLEKHIGSYRSGMIESSKPKADGGPKPPKPG